MQTLVLLSLCRSAASHYLPSRCLWGTFLGAAAHNPMRLVSLFSLLWRQDAELTDVQRFAQGHTALPASDVCSEPPGVE